MEHSQVELTSIKGLAIYTTSTGAKMMNPRTVYWSCPDTSTGGEDSSFGVPHAQNIAVVSKRKFGFPWFGEAIL